MGPSPRPSARLLDLIAGRHDTVRRSTSAPWASRPTTSSACEPAARQLSAGVPLPSAAGDRHHRTRRAAASSVTPAPSTADLRRRGRLTGSSSCRRAPPTSTPTGSSHGRSRGSNALGAQRRGLPVLTRPDALDEAIGDAVRTGRFVYLAGGSPMHLRSVLKETPVWEAPRRGVAERRRGRRLVGRGHGAVPTRWSTLAAAPSPSDSGCSAVWPSSPADQWSPERSHRTYELARGFLLAVVAVDGARPSVVAMARGGPRPRQGAGHARRPRGRPRPPPLTDRGTSGAGQDSVIVTFVICTGSSRRAVRAGHRAPPSC